jgi:enterochelin esterase-like enzyme
MKWWSLFRSPRSRHAPRLATIRDRFFPSLERTVDIDVYLPPGYDRRRSRSYPLLICNDGQDLPRMDFTKILENLYRHHRLRYLIVAGVHASHERHREYGTVRQPDYRGRGDRAAWYRDFILTELLPLLYHEYRLSGRVNETAIAGFSLGGLSALDIAWENPGLFGAAGAFSASLWWRWAPVAPHDPDAERIMHDIIQQSPGPHPGQRFWFQCGTLDELEDRNNNGVIDSIDDTLDLIRLLREKGQPEETIRYVQIEGGEHEPRTWGEAMPDFLLWTFGTT